MKRIKAKLLKKLELWHCYECGKVTKPRWVRVSESPKDTLGVNAPFCRKCYKLLIDNGKYTMYNDVKYDTAPETESDFRIDHIEGDCV